MIRSKKTSLRLILVVPFVLQITAAVGLTGYLSLRNGQKAVNDLASRLRTEVSDRVNQHLDTYLSTPQKINQLNADAVRSGLLDPLDFKASGRIFRRQIEAFGFGYINYGLVTGEFSGSGYFAAAGILKPDEIHISEKSDRTNGKLFYYQSDSEGNRIRKGGEAEYDFEKEAWYSGTLKAGKPIWSKVYSWDDVPEVMSIGASQPLYDKNNQVIGAISIDLLLSKIGDFLRSLKASPSGKTFIIERDGLLIASSSTEKPFTLINDKAERLSALKSRDRQIQAAADYLKKQFGDFKNIQSSQELDFVLEHDRQFLRVTPWRDANGLDWLVVVIVPESDFMAQINANTRTTILLCLGALALATVLGIYTSRWITQPILRLSRASEAIAAGELDQHIQPSSVDELDRLAQSFNRMGQQLKESFTKLEQSNQDLEHRVAERTVELQLAKENADAANHAKSDFLANMSHELRTPLNGVLGYAQILARTALTEQQQHGVSIIYQCGSHLLTLINDVLDLSKIEARKMELHLTGFHLPSFLQAVVEICRIKAEQKGIDFIYEPPANLPTGIIADEKRLRQVLINLLGNAVKFTDRGHVTFQVSVHTIAETHQLHFAIQDTGVGMSADQLETIFLPFEQVGETKRQTEGTGLGLAISQKIVEMMGSQIRVTSELGQGSTFEFEMACPSATDWIETSAMTGTGKILKYAGEPKQVLIVDDRWENRAVIVNLLESVGFKVIEAQNGQEGLEKARFYQPDLIIADLAMPVMDGWTMVSEMRQSEELKTAIVVISSASVYEIDRQKSIDAGGDDFLSKPVQAEELYQMLAKYLQLEWIYAEPELAAATTAELVIPTASELSQLLKYSQQGYIAGIKAELATLAQINPAYEPFVNQFTPLLKEFNLKQIRKLLQDSVG
ncbi:ATP-binding protein [Leptolyngbya sp. AN03gr2]|uniref:hybrid sensor histidine kinase/response regulator n=1 Tax=unclassified Leptolyngbya TaxID=2650499 RepID=UPI003D323767